jgi:hypothetical protein
MAIFRPKLYTQSWRVSLQGYAHKYAHMFAHKYAHKYAHMRRVSFGITFLPPFAGGFEVKFMEGGGWLA